MIDLAAIGLTPIATPEQDEVVEKKKTPRKPGQRRLLGLPEAIESGASPHAIRTVVWETVKDIHTERAWTIDQQTGEPRRTSSTDIPAHTALALAPGDDWDIEFLTRYIPSAKEQSAIKIALMRLAFLTGQGLTEETAITEAVRIPAVFQDPYDHSGVMWGSVLDGCVHIPPGNAKRTRDAELVARRVVLVRDGYAYSGWRRDGYLVPEAIAKAKGWL